MASWMFYLYSIASICVIYWVSKWIEHLKVVRKVKEALDQLPSAKKHWFSGHAHLYSLKGEANLESIRKCMAERPRIEAFWLGNWMVGAVRVWHPDTVKDILKSSEPKYITKLAKGWMGDCLKLTSGAKWRRNRGLVNPGFHAGPLKEYIVVKNERAKVLSEKLLKYAEEDRSIEMCQNFTLLSLEIIFKIACSVKADLQSLEEEEPYMKAISKLLELWNTRLAQPWIYLDWFYSFTCDGREWKKNVELVHQFAETVIAQRKKLQEKLEKPENILDVLLNFRDEAGNGLPDEEIRDEVTLLMLAGHNTAPRTLSWLAYTLAAYPEAQEKCQEEVDNFFDRTAKDITDEDMGSFPFLTMCINESMRLNTTLPIVARELTKPLTIDGVELQPYTVVLVYLYGLHHNPQVWDEPMKFNPERFLPENIEKMDPYSFLPFSAGPRNCIGKTFAMNELKVIMATLLRKVTFKVDEDRIPIHQPSILMMSENGIHLKIEKR